MFIQAYEFSLGQKISPGRVVLGKCEFSTTNLQSMVNSLLWQPQLEVGARLFYNPLTFKKRKMDRQEKNPRV